MSPIAIAAIIMLVLLFLNVPVFASVLGACVTYFVLNPSAGLDGMLAMQRVISGIQSVPMLAIPFFVAAGALMNYCGITDRMLKFCKVLTGHMYGGLGQVNIVLSTLMGGMSGSSLADIPRNVAFRALARRGHLAESFGKHLSLQSFLCAFRSSSSEVSVWVSVLLPRLVQSQLLMQ